MAVTDQQRQQVIALAREGHSRNHIARELHMSGRTVSEICKAAGHTFNRGPEIATATAARAADAAKKRAAAEADELEILRLQQEMILKVLRGQDTFQTIMRGEFGVEETKRIGFIPSGDLRNLAQAREKSVTMITNLALANADTGIAQAKSMLTGMMDALGKAWRGTQDEPAEDTGGA